jgi:hypothetical protein
MARRGSQLLEELERDLGKRSQQNRQAYDDLLYTVRDLAQREQLPEDALRKLAAKICSYLATLHDPAITWDQVEYHAIRDLRDPALEWKDVKIRALLERMTEPLAITLTQDKHLTTVMTFGDPDSCDSIDSTPTVNTDLVRPAAGAVRQRCCC